jgi:hypothetical protein
MVIALGREDVAEPGGDQAGAEAEGHGGGEDEAVAAGGGNGRDNADAGEGDGRGGGHKRRGEFPEDAHDDKEEAATVADFAVHAFRERDDAVVLGEAVNCNGSGLVSYMPLLVTRSAAVMLQVCHTAAQDRCAKRTE